MPSLKLGNNNVTTVKIGSTQVNKVYLGSNLVWSSFVPSDPDAAAYINAMNALPGVTLSTTEQQAIDNLFIRMKGNDPLYPNSGNAGIWTATRALYPYLGSNLEAYKYNSKYPTSATVSSDTAGYPTGNGYQYIAGGITVDGIYGPKGNGTNGVILTQLNWAQGLASSLTWNSLCMGAVYKTTSTAGRDDFGWYSTNPAEAGIWLRTKPSPANARMGCLEGSGITGSYTVGGNGHWMLWRSAADKRVYYQQVQQTYPAGADRTGEGNLSFGGQTTWPFLALNFNNFNGTGGGASAATRAANCVNYSNNTLMLNYVMTPFADSLIPAWNQMVEAFCAETGKKTW